MLRQTHGEMLELLNGCVICLCGDVMLGVERAAWCGEQNC